MDEENYWGDVLQSFQNGVQLDLRVKLAIEFLKSPARRASITEDPKEYAAHALDLATELLNEAKVRGLTRALPEDDGLSKPMRQHIRRNIRAQVVQQRYGAEISAEESNPLAPPPPISIVPKRS